MLDINIKSITLGKKLLSKTIFYLFEFGMYNRYIIWFVWFEHRNRRIGDIQKRIKDITWKQEVQLHGSCIGNLLSKKIKMKSRILCCYQYYVRLGWWNFITACTFCQRKWRLEIQVVMHFTTVEFTFCFYIKFLCELYFNE